MRIFIDTNILVATLNKEYPLFTWSSRILSLQGKHNIELSPHLFVWPLLSIFQEKKVVKKWQEKK